MANENPRVLLVDDDKDLLQLIAMRLTAAGYVLDEAFNLWINSELDRALDARIAARLTLDQIDEWIAAR